MNIVYEILHGTWLLESPDPQAYRNIANNILSGGSTKHEKAECYTILGKQPVGKQEGAKMEDQVSVISMIGEMTKRTGMCNYGADYICSEMLKADSNPDIKGHILFSDGPGGNADAMPLFLALKSQLTKPVVALVERACSLHYWTICELSDHIMMANDLTAEVGSIGAQISFEKPTNELIVVRPKQSHDKNEPFIQALSGNTELLEEKLEPLAIAFQKGVKTNRPNVKEETLHGKTYYAKDAIALGLADSIGNMQKAYNLVLTKAALRSTK